MLAVPCKCGNVFIVALRAGLAKDTTAGGDVIALTVTPARRWLPLVVIIAPVQAA